MLYLILFGILIVSVIGAVLNRVILSHLDNIKKENKNKFSEVYDVINKSNIDYKHISSYYYKTSYVVKLSATKKYYNSSCNILITIDGNQMKINMLKEEYTFSLDNIYSDLESIGLVGKE